VGQIVGGFSNSSGDHGFLFRPTGRPGTGIGTYTTIDGPSGTSFINAEDINDSGQIVGRFTDASGFHGFLLSSGTFVTLDDPAATQGTFAFGINNLGQIVGDYQNATGFHGFLLSGGPTSRSTIPRPLMAPTQKASTTQARLSASMRMQAAFTALSWSAHRTRHHRLAPPRT
jgi:probable HAF family extracellular repeat protein